MRRLEQGFFGDGQEVTKGYMDGYFIFFSSDTLESLKNPCFEAGGAQDNKKYLPYNRFYFLHPSSTTCMHQGFKALKSKL